MMKRTIIRARTRALRGRKAITKSPTTLQRRRAISREALWLELKNESSMSHQSEDESSKDEDIVGVAITNHEISLPPPPMCLMAKGNSKVSDAESGESDDELDPNKFSNLIHEYTCIIKREKCNVKNLRVHISHSSHLTIYGHVDGSVLLSFSCTGFACGFSIVCRDVRIL
jgi:hypothetical protein